MLFWAMIPAVAFGLSESTGAGGSNVQAVHDLGYLGQDVNIGLVSVSNILDTHEAFQNDGGSSRAFNINNPPIAPTSYIDHDTQAAGIAIARGANSYPDNAGAAPKATLYSMAVTDLNSNLAAAIQTLVESPQQCRVIFAVIQDVSTNVNQGESFWSLLYDYYACTYDVIFANAVGNGAASYEYYPYQTPPTSPGDSYNGITTGGLITTPSTDEYDYDKIGSWSLSGSTSDYRRKPDIAAPSSNQIAPAYTGETTWAVVSGGGTAGLTSFAVPHTAGVAAVLLDYADESGDTDREHGEVIKAVMVNSTFPNIISKAGLPTTGLTWQADRGYGRLDALRALKTLGSDRITPGSSTSDPNGWAYETLSPGGNDTYTLIERKTNERLLVTVTWHRRVLWTDKRPWSTINDGELTGYLANLDLEVRDPDGILLNPNPSEIDNLEKVDLLLTKTGNYDIRVVNQSGSESAAYGLAFEILEPLTGDVHVDYVVDIDDVTDMAARWLNTGCDNPAADCYGYNLSPDPSINLSDFAVLAENWLMYDGRYHTP